jgi:hypothetical protein
MVLRFQRITPMVSPQRPRPDARGVTMRHTARQTRDRRVAWCARAPQVTMRTARCAAAPRAPRLRQPSLAITTVAPRP